MTSPSVSIIVPNYNHASYLRQRLDSIFNQTYQDFEVVILDDCSTDNSKDVIEEFRNRPQISHVVYNETNSGSPFKQWAKGFELAQGEYIWIAESDDWAELNFLENIIPFLNSDSQIVLAFSASNWVYSDHIEKVFLRSHNFLMNGTDFIKSRMICGNSIHNASAVVFRKDKVKFISDNYTKFKGSGDYLFWVNLCETGKALYIATCLNNFRKHNENTTKKSNSSGNVYKEDYAIFNYLNKKGYISTLGKKCVISFYLTKIKHSSNQCNRKEFINLWKKESKNLFFYQSFCFLIGLFIRPLSQNLKEVIEKKMPWSYYYNNYSALELIWNMLHLPNTNFKRLYFKNK